jgi:hypothetical protein
MFGFLKRLFGMADRTDRAGDRIALAMEELADDLEAVRAAVRQRLGLDEADAHPAALQARPASEATPEPAGPAPHRNGRGKARAATA